MAKGKDVLVKVILECTGSIRKSVNKGSRGVPDTLLKRIATVRLVGWNCKNFVPIVTNIQFMER